MENGLRLGYQNAMVEPQDLGELKDGLGAPLLCVLEARAGQPTIIRMANGDEELIISEGMGWGRDLGDVWEHVDVELYPPGQKTFLTFYMSDVECLIDPDTRKVLISQTPAPGET